MRNRSQDSQRNAGGSSATPVVIRPFTSDDAAAFYSLNERWISKHFGMEPRDHVDLGDPVASILDKGGHILMAFADGNAIGCCALVSDGEDQFELAKMTVSEDFRGRGIGRKILISTVALARSLGAHRLKLGSNTDLSDAVHLYESVGFRHIPPERRMPTEYARANIFMELDL